MEIFLLLCVFLYLVNGHSSFPQFRNQLSYLTLVPLLLLHKFFLYFYAVVAVLN